PGRVCKLTMDPRYSSIRLFRKAASELLCKHALVQCVQRDVERSSPEKKGDWQPLLFVMTDGSPSDLQTYRDVIPLVTSLKFANIVACAAGPKAERDTLRELTDTVVSLDTTDSATFAQFFKWVSA